MSSNAKYKGAGIVHLNVRMAEHEGHFWYDLTDDDWRAVCITDGIPSVKKSPPLLFRRFKHQSPQVEPICGGDFTRIFKYVNVKKEYRTCRSMFYSLVDVRA